MDDVGCDDGSDEGCNDDRVEGCDDGSDVGCLDGLDDVGNIVGSGNVYDIVSDPLLCYSDYKLQSKYKSPTLSSIKISV